MTSDATTVRAALAPLPASAQSAGDPEEENPQVRQPAATFNDICRLIHVAGDPAHTGLFTAAFQPMSRDELDRSPADRRDPWREIAARYNDYELCQYTNATVEQDGRSVAGLEAAYRVGQSWNPADCTRPPRDASWIRTHLGNLRKHFTKTRENFHRSGNQDAENIADEFAKFCQLGTHIGMYVLYAFVVWRDEMQSFYDRRLPQEWIREEGIGDSDGEADANISISSSRLDDSSAPRSLSSVTSAPANRKRSRAQQDAPSKRKRELLEQRYLLQQTETASAMQVWLQTTALAQQSTARKAEIDALSDIASNAALPAAMQQQALQRLAVVMQFQHQPENEAAREALL